MNNRSERTETNEFRLKKNETEDSLPTYIDEIRSRRYELDNRNQRNEMKGRGRDGRKENNTGGKLQASVSHCNVIVNRRFQHLFDRQRLCL